MMRQLWAAPTSGVAIALLAVAAATFVGSPAQPAHAQARADTAVVDALRAGDRRRALQLVGDGSDVNATEVDGTTALMRAAHMDDVELVESLLQAGADVSLSNDYGASAMSEAAAIGSAGVIRLLLDAGADPEARIPEGQTALMAVARTGNVEAAGLLLDAGADINAIEEWGGQSALMWAAAQSQADMVALLVARGADVDARGAVRHWQRKVTAEPRPKDLNKGGFTPLLYAAREGCIPCARHLLDGGADINLSDPDRVSPLGLAVMNFHFDFAAFMIDAGADVDRWDLYGQTPLYNAVDMNTLPTGGRTDIPTADGTSALELMEKLLAAGANPNLQLKLRPPYRNVVFDRGADPVLSTGATALTRAALAADTAAIRVLLRHGALVDLPNAQGITPLMAVAGVGYGSRATRGAFRLEEDGVEALELLLAAGADINARATNGRTALHGAARLGWNRIVTTLFENGSALTATDAQGRTPLDMAKGNYPPAFLDAPPDPIEDTVELLEELIRLAAARRP